MAVKTLSLVLLCLSLWLSGAFLPPIAQSQSIGNSFLAPTFLPQRKLASASANDGLAAKNEAPAATSVEDRKNAAYVDSLLENLTTLLDKWILTGSAATKQGAYNILEQIQLHARDPEQLELAKRRVQRAGLPFQQKEIAQKSNPNKELGRTDDERRRQDAEHRKNWEYSRTADTGKDVTSNLKSRSALSQRGTGEPDLLMGQFDFDLRSQQQFANDKVALQNQLDGRIEGETALYDYLRNELDRAASNKVSELVARAGTKSSFEGQNLGIGGLDDVLAQVKRRVWTPLAAPPELLSELGISPVRGLLLYGKPGCGKTLLARKLGQILSPIRPITVVSGPEIMDKFVGSSEMNLREIFDKPPDIYEYFRAQEADNGDAMAKAALHVIIMDEFDAIARHRGGRGGSGDQGDAGVARDSVVNQLLAKMDGVSPLAVPTLVIGLTNKRSLIDTALLRPGRFEVQIEVPPPRTVEQRTSILKVHTWHMQEAGRLLVRDAPKDTAAAKRVSDELPTYAELLQTLAEETDGFSGATLAAVARAAASHALERAVEAFTDQNREENSLLIDCVVTIEDFEEAKKDFENLDDSDYFDPNSTVLKAAVGNSSGFYDPKRDGDDQANLVS